MRKFPISPFVAVGGSFWSLADEGTTLRLVPRIVTNAGSGARPTIEAETGQSVQQVHSPRLHFHAAQHCELQRLERHA